jgi:hypothetical protein
MNNTWKPTYWQANLVGGEGTEETQTDTTESMTDSTSEPVTESTKQENTDREEHFRDRIGDTYRHLGQGYPEGPPAHRVPRLQQESKGADSDDDITPLDTPTNLLRTKTFLTNRSWWHMSAQLELLEIYLKVSHLSVSFAN